MPPSAPLVWEPGRSLRLFCRLSTFAHPGGSPISWSSKHLPEDRLVDRLVLYRMHSTLILASAPIEYCVWRRGGRSGVQPLCCPRMALHQSLLSPFARVISLLFSTFTHYTHGRKSSSSKSVEFESCPRFSPAPTFRAELVLPFQVRAYGRASDHDSCLHRNIIFVSFLH